MFGDPCTEAQCDGPGETAEWWNYRCMPPTRSRKQNRKLISAMAQELNSMYLIQNLFLGGLKETQNRLSNFSYPIISSCVLLYWRSERSE